jgi:hypothetical protein
MQAKRGVSQPRPSQLAVSTAFCGPACALPLPRTLEGAILVQ